MSIHQEVNFNAQPERIYEALLSSATFSKATGAPSEISDDAGGGFSCFGGQITGRNIELVPNQRIVQAWRVGAWPEGLYSIVRFEFKKEGSGTRLVLDHTGFPEDNRQHLEPGWHKMYWEPLRNFLA
ncbi:MAG TPA: SRPBCC family protein [Blastocatellia bacterium]|nr:SRPBCC family protein [Blastocatellia bacterium]